MQLAEPPAVHHAFNRRRQGYRSAAAGQSRAQPRSVVRGEVAHEMRCSVLLMTMWEVVSLLVMKADDERPTAWLGVVNFAI